MANAMGVPAQKPRKSTVLDAALKRLERALGPAPRKEPPPAPPRANAAPRRPVLTLEPPAPPGDPRALAGLLADDLAAKLDEICYVWTVIREIEPFGRPPAAPLRRRAAELALATAGGAIDLPIEPLVRAACGFLDEHGMDEAYVRKLAKWYSAGGR
jgi:hypothetical protein